MRIPPYRASLALALFSLLVAAAAFADVPNRPRSALNEAIAPHGVGGAAGYCSIIYYNLCSGWIWTYAGWEEGDEVGVAFDLPEDCGYLPGDSYSNTRFWWFWRYTNPGWGYTITYRVYNLDTQLCKSGGPVALLAAQDPTERWNYCDDLFGGWTTTSWVALTATYDKGGLPRFCTDNNYKNYQAPAACPGFEIDPVHTLFWGGLQTQYCPPAYLADGEGPVDCLMDAGFWDPSEDDAVERSTWTGVKSLFR